MPAALYGPRLHNSLGIEYVPTFQLRDRPAAIRAVARCAAAWKQRPPHMGARKAPAGALDGRVRSGVRTFPILLC